MSSGTEDLGEKLLRGKIGAFVAVWDDILTRRPLRLQWWMDALVEENDRDLGTLIALLSWIRLVLGV